MTRAKGVDSGGASLVMVGIAVVAGILACSVAGAGAAATVAARAQGAADAAALAAATTARDMRALGESVRMWEEPSCATARIVAAEWNAAVTGCTVNRRGVATVTVTVRSPFGDATRESRAGTR